MKMFLSLIVLAMSTSAFATNYIYLKGAQLTPLDPGQTQVIVHADNGDGKLYVKNAEGQDVSLSNAVSALSVSTSQISNAATTVETDLGSYSITAGKLSADGAGVKLHAAGTFAGSDTNKRIIAYLGATPFVDTASMSFTGVNSWKLDGECIRTASHAEKCWGAVSTSVSSFPVIVSYSTAAIDLTAAATIKVTGASSSASSVIKEVFEVLLKE